MTTNTSTVRIGGPLLAKRTSCSNINNVDGSNKVTAAEIPPLVWKDEYIFLPNDFFIAVLALSTGRTVARLLIPSTGILQCVCIIEDGLLIAGCRDGTLCEYNIANISGSYQEQSPRRVFHLPHQSLYMLHLTTTSLTITNDEQKDHTVLFGMAEKILPDATRVGQFLYRIEFPLFDQTLSTTTTTATTTLRRFQVALKEEFKCSPDTRVFRLLSTSRPSSTGGQDVFVLLLRTNGFQVYSEHCQPTAKPVKRPMTFIPTHADGEILTSLVISPNATDITCGYQTGHIRTMANLLSLVLQYHREKAKQQSPPPPHQVALVRRVHWHAHPVLTMAYAGPDLLYSGGEESVLVVWQLAKGMLGPSDVLPRVALGAIAHIIPTMNGIFMYCNDNTIQLVRADNRQLIWKVHGFPTPGNAMIMLPDQQQHHLVMTGLAGAPGWIHWLDPTRNDAEQLVRHVQVVPYNRVSRAGQSDTSMPPPKVTHMAMCGDDVMTVEVICTENTSVGVYQDDDLGTITAVKFWNQTEQGHVVTATMSFPHGQENSVSAIALSKDVACTVSNGEQAFRVWRRILSLSDDDDDDSHRRTPVWVCQYKVSSPAGMANLKTRSACFSPDGSTLAICYGHLITLWNHKDAVLVHTLKHCDTCIIDSIQFVSTSAKANMVMTRSRDAVFVQSPFTKGWKCAIPPSNRDITVLNAQYLASHEMVAICTHFAKTQDTKVLLVDAVTGQAIKDMMWNIPGRILSVASIGKEMPKTANWIKVGESQVPPPDVEKNPIRLYAVSSSGELLLLTSSSNGTADDGISRSIQAIENDHQTDVPRIYLERTNTKKTRTRFVSLEEVPMAKKRAVSADDTLGAIRTSDLPSLCAYARAYVGRNLARRVTNSTDGGL